MKINDMNKTMKARAKNILTGATVAAMLMTMVPVYSFAGTASKANNSKMVGKLPTSGITLSVPVETGLCTSEDAKGRFLGYDIYEDTNFIDAKASTKSGIKKKVSALTAGKANNYEKARAIHDFVQNHMTYYGSSICLDDVWKYGEGNCESYAALTSAMLYYAGIPNTYVYTYGHVFNLVLCDGRWVPSDSQSYFDGRLNYDYPAIETIVLRNGKLSYVIDDLSGMKLTGVGDPSISADPAIVKSGITIPAFVTGYYRGWMDCYPSIVIRGTKGTAGERLVKGSGYKCVHYSGSKFTARRAHATVKKTVKKPTYFAYGKMANKCKNCGKTVSTKTIAKKKLAKPTVAIKGAKRQFKVKYTYRKGVTGFQVAYKKAGAKKFSTRSFNSKKSVTKAIKRLKKGKYTVKVRAYIKSGSKRAYGVWTPARTVVVR